MLSEGHRRRRRGADVAIGFVECHGRQRTEELIDGLEVIRRRTVDYRVAQFAPGTDAIVRRSSRMAARIKADLQVLHVATGKRAGRSPNN